VNVILLGASNDVASCRILDLHTAATSALHDAQME
jgi:hypothetical protein